MLKMPLRFLQEDFGAHSQLQGRPYQNCLKWKGCLGQGHSCSWTAHPTTCHHTGMRPILPQFQKALKGPPQLQSPLWDWRRPPSQFIAAQLLPLPNSAFLTPRRCFSEAHFPVRLPHARYSASVSENLT